MRAMVSPISRPVLDQDGPQLSSLTRSATNNVNTVGQPLGATVANPFPTGITPALGHSQVGVDNLLGSGVWARVPDQPLGYSQQWNLAVERSFGAGTTASIAYAGAKGTHLIIASPYTGSGLQLNQIPDQYLSMGNDLLTPVANPFYGKLPAGSAAGGPTILKGRLLLPYSAVSTGRVAAGCPHRWFQLPRFADKLDQTFQPRGHWFRLPTRGQS